MYNYTLLVLRIPHLSGPPILLAEVLDKIHIFAQYTGKTRHPRATGDVTRTVPLSSTTDY